MKKITGILLALMVALGVFAAGAPAAQAVTGPFGGTVKLDSRSTGNLKVAGNLGVTANGSYYVKDPVWLAPGQSSKTWVKDADGFQAPYNCTTWINGYQGKRTYITPGKTHKISDLATVWVTVKC